MYQGASEVVIVVLADKLEERLAGYLEEQAARGELRGAVFEFLDALGEPQGLADAVARHGQAWTDYRLSLYRPLLPLEMDLNQCLKNVARDAAIYEGTSSAVRRIRDYPALRSSIEERYGSIERYAEDLFRKDRVNVDTRANSCIERYDSGRASTPRTIYEDHRRSSPLLTRIEDPASVLTAYEAGTESSGFQTARASLRRGLDTLSANRIQSYDDELELLELVASWLASHGHETGPVTAALETVRRTKALDERLLGGSGLLDTRVR